MDRLTDQLNMTLTVDWTVKLLKNFKQNKGSDQIVQMCWLLCALAVLIFMLISKCQKIHIELYILYTVFTLSIGTPYHTCPKISDLGLPCLLRRLSQQLGLLWYVKKFYYTK